jgi:hypothetical protein
MKNFYFIYTFILIIFIGFWIIEPINPIQNKKIIKPNFNSKQSLDSNNIKNLDFIQIPIDYDTD